MNNENNKLKTYRCTVCGYEHQDCELADDYACPICGVGKDLFEEVDE
jgi:rubredoxin